MNKTAEKIKKILAESSNIVVLSGLNVMRETGLNGVRAEHIAYDIEEKYGYSNDEIVSSAFFARRGDIFYDYYKNVILNVEDIKPTVVHKAIRQMEKEGRVSHIITRTVYELYEKAGCEHVIDMHGSAEKNTCQICGKTFGIQYVKKSQGVPVCDVCKVSFRPGFTLLGEQVDNGKVSDASEVVEKANVLLILGANVRSALCQYVAKYYQGNKMILINTEEKMGDDRADYQLYGKLSELVPYVTGYEEKSSKR